MPPKVKITDKDIIAASLKLVRNHGIDYLNTRNIAKELQCSTQPIFRNFENMEDLKNSLIEEICTIYDDFINDRIDPNHRLLTHSWAYVEFARQESSFFDVLFMIKRQNGRDLKQVIDSPWNRETINGIANEYKIPLDEAENLYRDVRFYTHGIATQIHAGSLTIDSKEVEAIIKNLIEKLLS